MYYDQITEFVFQEDKPQKADFIFIPGSGYGELARKAAQLYHAGYAKKIIVSGKYSILGKKFAGPISPSEYCNRSYETESDFLKEVLTDCGVKEEDIIQEKEATFTYENAIYIRMLLEKMGYSEKKMPDKVILVCQAFHGARSRMYFEYLFPETKFFICPAQTQGITRDNWQLQENGVRTVMGEVERIGKQFTDILTGKDEIQRKCRNSNDEKVQRDIQ